MSVSESSGRIEYIRANHLAQKEKKALEALLKEFEHQKDIASCHSNSKRYPIVKNWFLNKFPEVAKFGLPKKENEESSSNEKVEEVAAISSNAMDNAA